MKIGFIAVARFAWRYWRERPRMMLVLGVGIALATATELGIPLAVGGLTDAVAGDTANPESAFRWLLVLVGLSLLFHAFHHGGDYLWGLLQVAVMRRIGADSFARVQRYSSDWHANSFAGKTVRNISRGIWEFDQFGDLLYFHLLPAAAVMLGFLGLLTWHWPTLGLAFFVGATLYVGVSIWLNVSYVSPMHRRVVETDSAVSGAIADAVGCNAVVKATAAEDREDARLGRQLDTWQRELLQVWFASINTAVVQSVILALLQLVLVALAIGMWARGDATPGDVTFVLFVNVIVRGYLRNIGQNIRDLQQAVNDLEPVVRYMTTPPTVSDSRDVPDLLVKRGAICFDAVRFGYRREASWLFNGLDLDIAAGEKVALVGRSGSGKTTLTKLVQRLYEIDEGQILIDSQDIAQHSLASLRRSIALVAQEPVLFHRSLAENIAYARPEASLEEIKVAARRAHAAEFIERLDAGYETLVGERGVKLSGGERQRVAIARAILADAPVLILDEATSSLDSVSEALIQAAMVELMAGRTTIVIAHRLSTIREVDRILVFDRGRIVEQGRHDELLRRSGVYAELYQAQLGAYIAGAA